MVVIESLERKADAFLGNGRYQIDSKSVMSLEIDDGRLAMPLGTEQHVSVKGWMEGGGWFWRMVLSPRER